MTRIELLKLLTDCAISYRKDKFSISRNKHLTNLDKEPNQEIKDAVLTDFINYVGIGQELDYGLHVNDLKNN